MPKAYNGKILRVDLTTGKIQVEEPGEVVYRTYFRGGGLSSYYLLKELKPGVDPLGPENTRHQSSSSRGREHEVRVVHRVAVAGAVAHEHDHVARRPGAPGHAHACRCRTRGRPGGHRGSRRPRHRPGARCAFVAMGMSSRPIRRRLASM